MGRSPQQSDVVIDEPHISRAHCIVYVDDTDGSVLIRHDGGANGTYVNDVQVQTTPHQLRSGDVVWLGPEVAYRVELVTVDDTVRASTKRETPSVADADATLESV
jgi:pSer/pThr/pTyr-binding forkhead associated (FHA) protein